MLCELLKDFGSVLSAGHHCWCQSQGRHAAGAVSAARVVVLKGCTCHARITLINEYALLMQDLNDPLCNLTVGASKLKRKVEMFQWIEKQEIRYIHTIVRIVWPLL